MNPGMYIFLNRGAGMSTGKAAAQAGHAAVEAFRLSMRHPEGLSSAYYEESNLVRLWYKGGHYAKYVMACRDDAHLRDTERYLNDRGFKTALILDEGHTEVAPITPTALGVELVDRDDPHVQATFSSFDLYKDEQPRILVLEEGQRLHPVEMDHLRELYKQGKYADAERYARALYEWRKPHKRRRFWQR